MRIIYANGWEAIKRNTKHRYLDSKSKTIRKLKSVLDLLRIDTVTVMFKLRAEMLVHLALQKENKSFMTFPSAKHQLNYNEDSSDDEPGNFDPVSDYESDDDLRTRVEDILSPKRQRRNNEIDICNEGEIIAEKEIQQEEDQHVQMVEDANDREEDIADEEQSATMQSKRRKECDEVNAETAKHPKMRPCNCKMKKCDLKTDDDQKELDQNAFWRLKYNDRQLWMYNHVEQYEPKRRYTLRAVAKIQMSRNYWLPVPSLPSRKC